jgi:[acyl-carrier-protein] S-malonyltransferase
MGADLLAESADARRVFDLADEITGLPITRLCVEGPLDRLTETDVAQPAVVAASLAALAVVRQRLGVDADAVAGHSVGEYAAYAAAGILSIEDALKLVHARAQAMAAACQTVDGTMAAVIGLDEAALRLACDAASHNGSSVEVANLNSPGQLIVSGARDAIERVAEHARAAGARRILRLNVGGPFHSVYMRPAAATLENAVAETMFHPARVPVVLNATAEVAEDPRALRQELEVQVYSPVRWTETIQRLAELGCNRFLEVGPGQVLAGLVKRTLPPDVRVASFGSRGDLPAAESLVA